MKDHHFVGTFVGSWHIPTIQCPGNIRAMEWAWIDLGNAMLSIPAANMKRVVSGKVNGKPHYVPLAKQAVAILQGLKSLTGSGRYVFPGARFALRPMSENTINAALKRMDFGSDPLDQRFIGGRLGGHPQAALGIVRHGERESGSGRRERNDIAHAGEGAPAVFYAKHEQLAHVFISFAHQSSVKPNGCMR